MGMYLPPYANEIYSQELVMSLDIRAKKCANLWKQLNWLEEQCRGPYLASNRITHTDY